MDSKEDPFSISVLPRVAGEVESGRPANLERSSRPQFFLFERRISVPVQLHNFDSNQEL